MSAEQFLKQYEQDQCEYCHGKYQGKEIDFYDYIPLLDPHDYGMVDISAYIIKGGFLRAGNYLKSGVAKINFCPMCGRKLGGY